MPTLACKFPCGRVHKDYCMWRVINGFPVQDPDYADVKNSKEDSMDVMSEFGVDIRVPFSTTMSCVFELSVSKWKVN